VSADESNCNKPPVPQTVTAAFRNAIVSMMKSDNTQKSRVNELIEDNDLMREIVHFCAFKVLAKFQLGTNINEENIEILSERIEEIESVLTPFENDELFKRALDEDVVILKNAKDSYAKKIGYLRAAEVLSLKLKRSETLKEYAASSLSSIRDNSSEAQIKRIKLISRYDNDDEDEDEDELDKTEN